jgi:hypothetical protein
VLVAVAAAWQAVTSRVSDARAVSRLRALAYPGGGGGAGDGAAMFGLRHPAVLYLLEQLHGASRMRRHVFQHRTPPSATTHDDVSTRHATARSNFSISSGNYKKLVAKVVLNVLLLMCFLGGDSYLSVI